jgi:DNA-binding response OmpR family regulator
MSGRILLVDENDDHRELIATALEAEGYPVDRAVSAADALHRLRKERYGLVLGHYGLPDQTAVAMLKNAHGEGLLDGTATMIMTGQPDAVGVPQHELITKPLELSRLLRQVRTALGPPPERKASAAAVAVAPVELALYLTLPWPSSLKAKRNLERVLAGFQASQVRLSVHDLAKDPARAEADGIVFSPTLVKRFPEPRAWVMGDLSDRRVLANLLLMCGLEPRKGRR